MPSARNTVCHTARGLRPTDFFSAATSRQKTVKLSRSSSFAPCALAQASDAERLIPWGRFLRSTSLDELPELWNVLRGEMSLVGPRPLPITYLERYSAAQAQRHDVRPGITGWAQINGRNGLTWKRQFELDLWYVKHRTFWLDLKILLLNCCYRLPTRKHFCTRPGHSQRILWQRRITCICRLFNRLYRIDGMVQLHCRHKKARLFSQRDGP